MNIVSIRPSRCIGIVLVLLATSAVSADDLTIDCAVARGEIRPLHGVNGGPLSAGETLDFSTHWRELQIPSTRLHDCDWPSGRVVDMHALFLSPHADPKLPESYRFQETDDYLASIFAVDASVVFRLGESIEHTRRKYHVHPPADPDRWAEACAGVVRHYNHGWAEGHKYGIKYWEIWNEPENRPAMWTGTDDDYFKLYRTAAKRLKREFPELKIGGPSVGATGKVIDGVFQPTTFLAGFLADCRRHETPLDFFSWHTYTDDPSFYARKAHAIRKWLNQNGYDKTEIHLNEWNYLPDNDWGPLLKTGQGERRRRWADRMTGAEGAAFLTCALAEFQDAPIDVANYYHGDAGAFGLFTEHGEPTKKFHAMKSFRLLLNTPHCVQASGGEPGRLSILAGLAKDRRTLNVLIGNYRSSRARLTLNVKHLPWSGSSETSVRFIDAANNLTPTDERVVESLESYSIELPAPGAALITLREK